ncbi:MAG TPA: universal stress protein [Planctomycetota bacterium]|nr:universal stress protein [Planctomycetota bacterium]
MKPRPFFKRLLVPLDGSPEAEAILPVLPGLLSRTTSEVILLQAVPFMATLLRLPVSLTNDPGRDESDTSDSRRYLDEIAKRLRSQGIFARGIVRIGAGAETILEVAREERVTLIAMSIHAPSRMTHFLHASVTEKALRASKTPFFIIHVTSDGIPTKLPVPRSGEPGFRDILVPLGSGPVTLGILPFALRMARLFGSRLRLLHVLEPHDDPQMIQRLLKTASALSTAEGVPSEETLRPGDPRGEILAAARELPTDLIAMATHGLPATRSQGPLGNVPWSLVEESPWPVLLVRGAEPPDENAAEGGTGRPPELLKA